MNVLDRAFADFVAEGDDNYIGLWQITGRIARQLNLNEKNMTLAEAEKFWATLSDFVTRMLTNGFRAVDLIRNSSGCIPWPEQEPQQVMAKVKKQWIQYGGKSPDVGFIVWFNKVGKTPR